MSLRSRVSWLCLDCSLTRRINFLLWWTINFSDLVVHVGLTQTSERQVLPDTPLLAPPDLLTVAYLSIEYFVVSLNDHLVNVLWRCNESVDRSFIKTFLFRQHSNLAFRIRQVIISSRLNASSRRSTRYVLQESGNTEYLPPSFWFW